MLENERRLALADFLRQRRKNLSPADVGLPPGMRRRTPGLRREEVAQLANMGTSWYIWLEQGRDVHPSAQVLESIAQALQLTPNERRHLFCSLDRLCHHTRLPPTNASAPPSSVCSMTSIPHPRMSWGDGWIIWRGTKLPMPSFHLRKQQLSTRAI